MTIAAGAFCFSALGIAVSTFVPNEDAAPAVVNFAVFPLLFISGTFGRIQPGSALDQSRPDLPGPAPEPADGVGVQPLRSGTGLIAGHLGMLVLWGAIGLLVALRRFRGTPRHLNARVGRRDAGPARAVASATGPSSIEVGGTWPGRAAHAPNLDGGRGWGHGGPARDSPCPEPQMGPLRRTIDGTARRPRPGPGPCPCP